MNTIVEAINAGGRAFVSLSLPMLIQSGVLILILLAVDTVLRRRVRAVFRYWIWMLVLVKLVLPPSLGSPVSVGRWLGGTLDVPAASLLESKPSQLGSRESPALAPTASAILSPPDPAIAQPLVPLPAAPARVERVNTDSAPVQGSQAGMPIAVPPVSLDWQGLALLVWALVVMALALLLVQRAFFVRGLVGQADEANRPMLDELEDCRRRLRLRRPMGLRLSPNATSPAVCGLLRPVILIPQPLAPRLRAHDLQAVLLHELAHVKRGDLWINLAQTLLQIVYFYNPLLWLANAMIRRTREQAVDETVLVAMGATAKQYPETLVNIAKLAFTRRPALSLRLIGVVESKSALTARIKHMLNRPIPKNARLGLLGLLAVSVLAAVLLPMAEAKPVAETAVPEGMVGTWLYDNPGGEDEQMAVFPDGRVVVLYSNGYWDETRYDHSFITLHEYNDIRVKLVLDDNGTLLQYAGAPDTDIYGKRWRRIAPEPQTDLLAPLTGEALPTANASVHEIVLRDVDHEAVMLDLATGRLIPIPQVEPEARLLEAIRELGKGDLVLDSRSLILVRGATSPQAEADPTDLVTMVKIGAKLPESLTVMTVEGQRYEVTILAADDEGCTLKYSSIRVDRGAGGGASVEPEKAALFQVHGVVTDATGGPMAGVEVMVDCGFEKPKRSDRAFTDENGRYTLTFKPTMVVADADPYGVGIQPAFVWARKDGFYETSLRHKGNLAMAGKKPGPDEQRFVADRAGVVLPQEPYELNFTMAPAARIEGTLVDAQDQPLAGAMVGLLSRRRYPSNVGFETARTDGDGRFTIENVPCTTFQFTCFNNPLGRSAEMDITRPGTWRLNLKYRQTGQHMAELTAVDLQEAAASPSVAAAWQNIGETIPSDANDARTLVPGLVLDGIGQDVEGKVFVSSIRDVGATGDRQYRFLLHRKDGQVLTPRYYLSLARDDGRLWEKFTFDMWYDHRAIDCFRLQLRQAAPGQALGIPSAREEIVATTVRMEKPVVSTAAPPGQYALSFDGRGDYLFVPDSESLRLPSSLTVEMWIKPEFPEGPLENRPGWAVLAKGAYMGTGHVSIQGFGITMDNVDREADDVVFFHCVAYDNGFGSGGRSARLSQDWIHVSETFDRDAYIPAPGHPLVIGRFLIPSEDPLHGRIAEIRVWDGAKVPDARRYADRTLTGTEPGLVACWTFEEGGGQIAYDISPNANHARLGSSIAPDNADPGWIDLQAPQNPADEISGQVLDPDGKPAVGAQVALITAKASVTIDGGTLQPPRYRGAEKAEIVETDAQGRFRFEGEPNEGFSLVAAHDAGFGLVGSDALSAERVVRLEKWGRVEGQVAKGRQPLEGQIWMGGLPNETWLTHRRDYRYETHCDAEGRFAFSRVPPGWFEVGYLTKIGDSSGSLTSRTPVVVRPGETAKVKLGGEGRPVIGRFVPPEGYSGTVYFGEGLRSLDTQQPDRPKPPDYDQMTKRQQQEWLRQWRNTPEAQAFYDTIWRDLNWRHYVFRIKADGTFRIEDVIAGTYNMNIWLEERLPRQSPPEEDLGGYRGTIEVPPIPGGRSDEPLDVGDLVLSMREPPLKAGEAAPLFEVKSLDDKDIRLVDYRGRFVLLSFWQPTFHPELNRLRELDKAYGAVGRLAIIEFAGSDTLQEVQNYVNEHKIEWPVVYLGEKGDSDIDKLYRHPVASYIVLVDPEGKIVATWLRGEKLTAAVRDALDADRRSQETTTSP